MSRRLGFPFQRVFFVASATIFGLYKFTDARLIPNFRAPRDREDARRLCAFFEQNPAFFILMYEARGIGLCSREGRRIYERKDIAQSWLVSFS